MSQTQSTFDRKKCLADLFVRLPEPDLGTMSSDDDEKEDTPAKQTRLTINVEFP